MMARAHASRAMRARTRETMHVITHYYLTLQEEAAMDGKVTSNQKKLKLINKLKSEGGQDTVGVVKVACGWGHAWAYGPLGHACSLGLSLVGRAL